VSWQSGTLAQTNSLSGLGEPEQQGGNPPCEYSTKWSERKRNGAQWGLPQRLVKFGSGLQMR
jgi:hypothetical protein